MTWWLKRFFIANAIGGITLLLVACGSSSDRYQANRYEMRRDAYPDQVMDARNIEDAVPQNVVRTKAGNKSPYTVLGKTYRVLEDTTGFTQTGYASWYGKKFHGHRTSNGETYDMYKMSAAHKTLPIPTYVRVTNLENGLSTVVRVNDRGPFHDNRIIDLSYAAATKLGYVNKGTAKVKIEALQPGQNYQVAEANSQPAPLPAEPVTQAIKTTVVIKPASETHNEDNYHLPGNTYLQVAALGSLQAAEHARDRLQPLTGYPVTIKNMANLFKVRIGPITDNFDLLDLRELVLQNEFDAPVVIYD
jgi:rare lipoprotein A